jgi:hypothetical protein
VGEGGLVGLICRLYMLIRLILIISLCLSGKEELNILFFLICEFNLISFQVKILSFLFFFIIIFLYSFCREILLKVWPDIPLCVTFSKYGSLSLSHTHTHTPTHQHPPHKCALALSLSLSLSLTHTHTHQHLPHKCAQT